MLSSCKSHNTVTDEENGEIVCQRCGIVLGTVEPMINYADRPEIYTNVDPTDYELGSFIGYNADRKHYFKQGFTRFVFKTDRNLIKGMILIEKYVRIFTSSKLAIKTAQNVFTKVRKIRRMETEPFAIACVLYSFRENKLPITIDAIAKKTGVKAKRFTQLYREIYDVLGVALPLDTAVEKVSIIANQVGVAEKVSRYAIELLNRTQHKTGSNPFGVASASLYIASGYEVTLRELALASSMTESSIRKSVTWLKKELGLKHEDLRKYSGNWRKTNSGYRCP